MTACARLSPDGYHCSLERGHPGDHEARGMDGRVLLVWLIGSLAGFALAPFIGMALLRLGWW